MSISLRGTKQIIVSGNYKDPAIRMKLRTKAAKKLIRSEKGFIEARDKSGKLVFTMEYSEAHAHLRKLKKDRGTK